MIPFSWAIASELLVIALIFYIEISVDRRRVKDLVKINELTQEKILVFQMKLTSFESSLKNHNCDNCRALINLKK